jgi:hypothetical protein
MVLFRSGDGVGHVVEADIGGLRDRVQHAVEGELRAMLCGALCGHCLSFVSGFQWAMVKTLAP